MESKLKGEFENFTGALKKVLLVSHDGIKTKLDVEKQARKQAVEMGFFACFRHKG